MKFRILLFVGLLAGWSGTEAIAQCNLQISPEDTVLMPCGHTQAIILSAFGNTGNNVLSNNFNDTTIGIGWEATSAATLVNPCGFGPDSTVYMWMGSAALNPRILTTQSFDLSLGALLCFDMRYAVQGQSSPCEGPDLSNEGVHLQFSVDNGATWNEIQYWDPNGGYDPMLTTWNTYCLNMPAAAETPNTKIRWYQEQVTNFNFDHWGIDNVNLTLQDTSYDYTWTHNGFIGNAPPPAYVNSDTVFTVIYSNPLTGDTCIDSVVVQTYPPTLDVSTIADITVCDTNSCVDLDGVAQVIFNVDEHVTFEDNITQPFADTSNTFVSTSFDIVVSGIDNLYLPDAVIESVCLNSLDYFNSQTGADIGNLELMLVCPSGDTILLVPDGLTSGDDYDGTCFSPSGSSIVTANPPYGGSYLPLEPFSNLNGCEANGTWQLVVVNNDTNEASFGTFAGWSIQFHDPEIVRPAVFSWAPTTNMTNSDSLNPTVCPTATTTYTLSVNDSLNCASTTHDITVDVVNLDSIQIMPTVTNETCDAANGQISLAVGGVTGNYSFDWSTGSSNSQLNNLTAGTYTVTLTAGCILDSTFVLTNTPRFDLSVFTQPSICDSANGSINLSVGNGSGNVEYDWDNGASTNVISNLPGGSYDVTINDTVCNLDTTIVIPSYSTFELAAITGVENCQLSDGLIDLLVLNSFGAVNYDWDNGETTEDLIDIPAGTYSVTISDSLCSRDTSFTIIEIPIFTVAAQILNETCELSNGGIGLIVQGNQGGVNYAWDNGDSGDTINGLEEGLYPVTITDSLCTLDTAFAIETWTLPEITGIDSILPYEDEFNGILTVEITGGLQPLEYSIDNGATYQTGNSFSDLGPGTYVILVADSNGCVDSVEVTISDIIDVVIPSVFNPGSNIDANSVFYVKGMTGPEVTIYSRWGRKVFEDANYQNDWDGDNQKDGTYYYIVKDKATSKIYKGFTQLMRNN